MNTLQIKNFAVQSRIILKEGVLNRILALGFDDKGRTVVDMPVKIQGGTVFMNQLREESFYEAWTALANRLEKHGIKDVCEEAAYTWFNRLVAIRIMQKNHFIEPVMQYVSDETRIPVIVDQARSGRLTMQLDAQDRDKLNELLRDSTKTNEQFNLLISAFCKINPVIFKCFGGIEKHISLLLPDNILAQGGFIDLLNNTPYITDEDYSKSELIGWLYQFYISEKKDEVFAKKGKYDPDEIPAATQIFTPNWIVKYMVENTIGRIYLDNNPYADEIKASMKYLVEPSEPTPKNAILKLEDLTEYKMIDNACGSGHILIEGFNLFYRLYQYEGYSSRLAIENIFQRNIIGIDLDTRAKQLATFALLMTAAKVDKSFLDCKVMPRVLDFSEPFENPASSLEDFLPHYYLGGSKKIIEETLAAFELLKDADSLGSIMKFDISPETRTAMEKSTAEWEKRDYLAPELVQAVRSMRIILALTDKYSAVCANPPYMGLSNMGEVLNRYVTTKYQIAKYDLCTTFVLHFQDLVSTKGLYGFIIPPSWMFLSTFEGLRRQIIENQTFISLLHLSRGVFGADFGSSSAIIRNYYYDYSVGEYFRLIERTFQEFDQDHLRMLFEKTLANKEFKYYFKGYSKEVTDIEYSENGAKIFYPKIPQNNFNSIPGNPIAYWVSDKIINAFKGPRVSDYGSARSGMSTTDNTRFLRFWHEVSLHNIFLTCTSLSQAKDSPLKWFPYNKGGEARKWYGNNFYVVNWYNDGEEIKYWVTHNPNDPNTTSWGRRIFATDLFFKPALTWSDITTGFVSCRQYGVGFIFDSCAVSYFAKDKRYENYIMSFLNTRLFNDIMKLINPTFHNGPGAVNKIPLPFNDERLGSIEKNSSLCVSLTKEDWDAHETSWDFRENELIRIYKGESSGEGLFVNANRLEDIVSLYKEYWSSRFLDLHAKEEQLNLEFIDIFGLQEELSPHVPLEEITILQNGEISIEDNEIVWHDEVIIKQLISYAIGCWMGRYRLDKNGLYIAHYPQDTEVCSYEYNGFNFEIDDDAIIPLMVKDNPFEDDNALQKIINFMKYVFGGDSFLTANMNYIEHCLGKSLEDYLVKDFWKDHKKMYQNRPIYWLFSSKKGAFQVLTYMHRMNPYTVERIRTKYLLPYIDYLKGRIEVDESRGADLSTIERKNLIKMKAALEECNEYHDRLHEVALAAIDFDLDDGVVVNYSKFGDVLAKIK